MAMNFGVAQNNVQQRLAKRMAAGAGNTGPRPMAGAPMTDSANPGMGYGGAQAFGRQVAGARPPMPAPQPYGGAQAFGRQVAGAAPPQPLRPWTGATPLPQAGAPSPGVNPISEMAGQPAPTITNTGPRPPAPAPAPLYPGSTGMAQRAVAGGANIPLALRKRYYGF